MEKTMLDFLNEVSIEKGYAAWHQVYRSHYINYIDCNLIPQEAGKRYAEQVLNAKQVVKDIIVTPNKY